MTNDGQWGDVESLGREQRRFFGELSMDIRDLFSDGDDHQLRMLSLDTNEQLANG